jgi:outer membrane immunogenic protein
MGASMASFMSYLAGGLVAATLVAPVAMAADMPVKAQPRPVAYAVSTDWNGFYLGVVGGGGWLTTAWSNATFGTYSGKVDGDGWTIGGTVGWNWQVNALVLGIEGDWSWTDLKAFPIPNCVANCSTEMKWYGTIRGRIGYAIPSSAFLVYATGGAAFANTEHTVVTVPLTPVSHTKTGWVVGGGIEGQIAPQWSIKVEYLHTEFDRQLSCPAGPCTFDNFANYVRTDVIRGGLNYRFGGPVVARY